MLAALVAINILWLVTSIVIVKANGDKRAVEGESLELLREIRGLTSTLEETLRDGRRLNMELAELIMLLRDEQRRFESDH